MANRDTDDAAERQKIESDFRAALVRIRKNKPENPVLAARAAKGKLKLNPMTLAMESGRSRTLIGFDGCAYQDVRDELLEASEKDDQGALSQIDDLKKQLEDVTKERDAAIFWQSEHLRARQKAERDVTVTQELLDDCRKQLAEATNGAPKLSKVKG
jgi:hypothetical protein